MEALRSLAGRIRDNPWIAVAIAGGALLVAAWLSWAIYVASDRGANEGVGVLIAWPALLLALALIALPIVGIYLLVRSLSGESGEAEEDEEPEEDEEDEEAEEPEEAEATEPG